MTIALPDLLVTGYQSGGTDGGGIPINGELGLADLSIEKPAAASGDDAPTETVSLNFGQLEVDYFTSGAAKSGMESGAAASFFAFDASFRGGVDVPSASQGSGHAGHIDIASYSWSAETGAAEAAGRIHGNDAESLEGRERERLQRRRLDCGR